MSESPILEVRDVHASYGNIKALKGISLQIMTGEIVAMIGANGAGKSTALMCICGIVPVAAGDVRYQGASILKTAAEKLPVMGLCQVPEGRRIFPRLSVRENLLLGAFYRRDHDHVTTDLDRVFSYFPVLKDRFEQDGGTLSGGEQQMLAIGRALMSRPKLLLLDEPSLGLAPMIVQRIFEIIEEVNKQDGVTILLVEQNANLALQSSVRGYVLETGSVTMEDKASLLLNNQEIRKAYLGE